LDGKKIYNGVKCVEDEVKVTYRFQQGVQQTAQNPVESVQEFR
jgi:hypothetical protein